MIPLSRIDVSEKKVLQFASKHITSVEELAAFFPRKYYDFRQQTNIRDLQDGMMVRVCGQIKSVSAGSRVEVILNDGTGNLKLVWFGGCYFYNRMTLGSTWSFCGKVSEYYGQMMMSQPLYHSESSSSLARICPIYSKITGMSDEYLQKKIYSAISLLSINSPWTEADALAQAMGLMDKMEAVRQMHQPTDGDAWKKANRRSAYNKIYEFYRELYSRQRNKSFCKGRQFVKSDKTKGFIQSLPFPLTTDQQKAIDIVMEATAGEEPLNAMVSGDVGCGKTVVALLSAILAWENGYQSIIMAPTLVLAKQHYEEMSKMAASLGIRFALLTSEAKAAERKRILKGVSNGDIHVLIGTHSVLSPELEFQNLGMTIVDEEHRFGAHQKELLESYDKLGAHHLAMTATPIPRTYASGLYGDSLTFITIETMPSGRKPVITKLDNSRAHVYNLLLEQIHEGHQGYVVCPFIEDSDNEKFKSVMSVKAITTELTQYCRMNAPSVKVACISGDMKQSEIVAVIDQFAAGEIDLLVSTTIVEVGVNVPNATAIAIINAERFGLSALHQLRGRVGRKGDQGYCYLVSKVLNEKLETMTKYHSGFKIAELDMKFRGPGDILGEDQTGDSAVIDLIMRWPKMSQNVRTYFANKKKEELK